MKLISEEINEIRDKYKPKKYTSVCDRCGVKYEREVAKPFYQIQKVQHPNEIKKYDLCDGCLHEFEMFIKNKY